jgi:RNA polymerase sigma-70 factor (ECF subfamily)
VALRARAGDRDALAELYARFARRVFGLCRHLLGSREAAEDARSEVFLRLPRALGTYDPTRPFTRWLLSVTGHHCLDLLRRRRRERRLFVADDTGADQEADAVAEPSPSPLSRLVLAERRAEVRAVLAALPDHYRVPLALRYDAELSYDEIAAALGLTRSHVATLIHRGKREVRRRLLLPAVSP